MSVSSGLDGSKVEQNDCLVKVGMLTCGKNSHELVFQGCKVESDENMVRFTVC